MGKAARPPFVNTKDDRRKRRMEQEHAAGGPDAAGAPAAARVCDGRIEPRDMQNILWSSYYKEQKVVPEGEWDEFEATMRSTLPVSFRLTGSPLDPACTALRNYMKRVHVSSIRGSNGRVLEPIAWFPEEMAWRFDVSRAELRGKGHAPTTADGMLSLGADTRDTSLVNFHMFLKREGDLGSLSRQEEVSMIPPLVLGVEPHHAVLDMCAAPGSKTQQLIEALEGDRTSAPSGYVVANDADLQRCRLLVHQCKRLNSAHIVVTHHEAQQFPSRFGARGDDLRFDRVLCDVPCSSDGTMRKAPDLWKRWSERLAHGVHRLQLLIACRGVELLKVGGRLVYSTCSLNPIEDEAVVCALLAKYSTSIRLVEAGTAVPLLKRSAVLTTWRVRTPQGWFQRWMDLPEASRGPDSKLKPTMFAPEPDEARAAGLEKCLRVLPHNQNTGGFFVALFEKFAEVPVQAEPAVVAVVAPAASTPAVAAVEEEAEAAEEKPRRPAGKAPRLAAPSAQAEASGAEGGAEAGPGRESILGVLHGKGEVGGCYDKLFFLKPELLRRLATFYGIDESRMPLEHIVARSATAKSLYVISESIMRLLKGDVQSKLAVVNTGIRVLEYTRMKDLDCEYRLCQEGLHALVANGLITKQLVRAPVSDLLLVYQKRCAIRLEEFTPQSAAQMAQLSVGCFALVSELDEEAGVGQTQEAGQAAEPAGDTASPRVVRKHLLVCAATFGRKQNVDVLISKAESNSLILWLGNSGVRATMYDQSLAALGPATS